MNNLNFLCDYILVVLIISKPENIDNRNTFWHFQTYSANKLVSDSCSAATALFCGIKTNEDIVGLDATVAVNDCDLSLEKETQLESMISWAQKAGKATGKTILIMFS